MHEIFDGKGKCMSTFWKKSIIALISQICIVGIAPLTVSAEEITPNPVISRECPVYSGTGRGSDANDVHYFSFWNGTAPDYLAYDLSVVPEEERRVINAVWYNASAYDVIGMYVSRNMEPSDYTIEINKALGGTYPEDGWEIVETVKDNTLSSRQHVIDFEGYNWIRINITGVDDKDSGNASINFDIHNVSDGVSDSWIFYGDSITAGGMNNCYGTGFATHINTLDGRYFPAQENGGIGGITSTDGRNNIDRWLSTYEGKYVSIAYGTNDAWGNQTGAEKYYENTVYMIDAVLAQNKVPILPKIPYATETGVNSYLDNYNAMIDKIYEEYSQVIEGPDFFTYFKENPKMLSSDGVHPSSEGYAQMRKIWAETMYENVYKSEGEILPSDIKGDLNNDGELNLVDIVLMKKYIMSESIDINLLSADFSGNGEVSVMDLTLMKREIVK